MRSSIATAVAFSMTCCLLSGSTAVAQETPGTAPAPSPPIAVISPFCTEGPTGRTGICLGKVLSIFTPDPEDPGANQSPAVGSTTRYVPYDRLTTGPDGQTCVTTGYREVTDPTLGDAIFQLPDQDLNNILATYPPCPAQPDQPAETPAMIATRYWEEVPLPSPHPHIAPGWAITGKLAYLETNGELQHTYTNSTPFGPLEIVATGAYYVDWGDGESSGPHSVEGKPWPDGEITHDYVWAKTYDIVVTERWTATWHLGGQSGVLRELRTTGTIDDFPARQIQAVIR